jgi:calmodulin
MTKSDEELRETFNYYDRDGNGHIDVGEFKELLFALGAVVTDDEVATGFEVLDSNKNGTIEYQEFVVWWNDH